MPLGSQGGGVPEPPEQNVDGIVKPPVGLSAPSVPWPQPSAEPLPSVVPANTPNAIEPPEVPQETGTGFSPENRAPSPPNIAQEAAREVAPPVDSLSSQNGNIDQAEAGEPHIREETLALNNTKTNGPPEPSADDFTVRRGSSNGGKSSIESGEIPVTPDTLKANDGLKENIQRLAKSNEDAIRVYIEGLNLLRKDLGKRPISKDELIPPRNTSIEGNGGSGP